MTVGKRVTRDPEVLEAEVTPLLPSLGGANVDTQVATAKRFPRSISGFMSRATEMATLTPEIAASCVYALPRGGKTVEGPSARLAEICAHAWGNLRIQAGANDPDDGDRFVVGRGESWDVETNVAIAFEVKRRITNRKGERFDDDMVMVTGNAAASIALRNAVLKNIPTSFWRPIYVKCRQVIAGDARTFSARQEEMFKLFAVMGVTEQRLCAALGIKGKADVTIDHMVTITGFYNALKDGETTIEEAFPEGGGLGAVKSGARKSDATAQQPQPQPTPTQPANAAAQTETPAPAATEATAEEIEQPEPAAAQATEQPKTAATNPSIGVIDGVFVLENGAMVTLDTGFRAGTTDKEIAAAAEKLKGKRVELVTRAPKSEKFKPTILEIIPVQ